MNNQRRGFLKMMAAAPVAAPVVMKSTLEALTSSRSLGASVATANTMSAKQYNPIPEPWDETAWMQQRLKELLTSRKLATQPSIQTDSHVTVSCEVDALRSVSPRNRVLIAARRLAEIEHKRHLSYLDSEIADFKKKLGPLASLIFEE